MRLQQLEADAQIAVPRDVGGQIKTLANDPRYALAWAFILDDLCRRAKLSYVPGHADARELLIWFEGRRFVGEQLQRIAAAPMTDIELPEPPARTMTEKATRRALKNPSTD